MKKKVFTTTMARAAMTLLALFCFHGGANAQKTLPYEYDFENCWVSTLEADGWSKVDCDENSGIYAAGSLEGQGQLQFVFEPNNEHEQYLISPELESSAAIKVTFYYQSLNNGKKATFEVGYSTTTSDISAFTWSEEVSANYGWKQYMNEIPAGSKFVAIKYTSTNEDCQLCLDGFSFVKAPGHYGTWMVSYGSDYMDVVNVLRDRLGLELTEAKELANSAPCYVLTDVYEEEAKTLATWLTAKGAMAYAKDMRKHEGYATWLESCGDNYLAVVKTLKDLLHISLKEAKDLADAAPCMVLEDVSEEEAQALADALNASGATAYVKDLNGKSYSLPYTYSFENNDLDGEGWRLKNCAEYTGIYNNENLADIYRSALEGDNCFLFAYNSNPPQYLISPLLEGTTGVAVSFYYVNYSNDYPETFQVGYSTTTNSPDAFIWNREVTAKDHNAWHQYKAAFPKGTKYVAVKYTSNDQYYLLLDDFCFEEAKPKPLPYTYGFENNDLEGEGWSLVDCDEDSEIYNNEVLSNVDCLAHEGNNCFIFSFNSNPPQYLISPLLEGTTGVAVSFYYLNFSNDYPETFQVGYSTTTNSPDAFKWGNEVTANDNTTWKQYKATFPKGTKYVSVKLTSNDQMNLFVDDFCFEEADGITLAVTEDNSDILHANQGKDVNVNFWGLTLKANMWNPLCLPFSMTAEQIAASPLAGATIHEYHSTQLDGTSATVNFTSECTEIEAGHPYVVKFSGEDIVDPIFENVYIPNYPVAVSIGNNDSFIKGTYAPVVLEAGDKNKLFMQDGKLYRPESETTVNAFSFYFELGTSYNNVTKFKFDFGITQPLPYTYGFENNDLEGEGWSLVDCKANTKIQSEYTYDGNYSFLFSWSTNPPQYLISPLLEGTTGLAVSFYYKNINNDYPETFQVGYSTTTNSIDAFKWGNEVTANDDNQWKQYKATFPKGTKYVAVKLTSNDQFFLILDNFCFEEATSILGDVNGDGLVDISDVVQLVNIILNDGNGGNQAADVNNDSHVDISDVVQLVNIILGS